MKMSLDEKARKSYIRVKCPGEECEEERLVFVHSKNAVICEKCGEAIAEPRGGKAEIFGEILSYAGQE